MSRQYQTALVVDDNRLCRVVAVALLERLGFFVATATNGREALAATADTRFAIILMDCDMPELDGLDVTLAIRQIEILDDHTLIIGVTSRANRAECLAVGMDDHIQKPLTMQALEVIMQRWGWRSIHSSSDLHLVRESLASCREEIELQTETLAKQHRNLDDQKTALGESIWDGTSNAIGAERRRLAEWEDSLQQREWALRTREQFLARRERATVVMESQDSSQAG